MIRGGPQIWAHAKFSWLNLQRSRGLWVVGFVAAMSVGSGLFWRDFSFGEAEGRFVLSFGWGLQNLLGMGLALAAAVQIWARDQEDKTLPVWRARGLSSWALATGRLLAAGLFCAIFAVGSTLVLAWAQTGKPGALEFAQLFASAGWLTLKLALVATMTFGVTRISRNTGFVIGATTGLILLGHLRPWAGELGGVPMVISWLAPDLSSLSPAMGQQQPNLGAGVVRALAAAGYGVVFLGLATREQSNE